MKLNTPLAFAALIVAGATALSGCASLSTLFPRGPEPDTLPSEQAYDPSEDASVAEAPVPESEPMASNEPIANPDRELVRKIQQSLADRGFDVGRPDGLSGKKTVGAIRLFKVARRMPVDDAITPRLVQELGI